MRLASFRDPSSSVALIDGRVFRTVKPASSLELKTFIASPVARNFANSGKLLRTVELSDPQNGGMICLPAEIVAQIRTGFYVVEHERVWFPSYPCEWPPEMLFAAGELTIELAQAALGFSLKDGTPYNVLFRGPNAMFVDVLSFERRTPGDPRWLPFGHFMRTFVVPLLINKVFGTAPAQSFLAARDGLEMEHVYRYLGWPQRLTPRFLGMVSMPLWPGRRVKPAETSLYRRDVSMPPDKADYILRAQLSRARKLLGKVRPDSGKDPNWSSYTENPGYRSEDYKVKLETVRDWLAGIQPHSVLDVGCNTGDFSQIAAEAGARVVAVDLDPIVVGNLYRRALAQKLNILPLVVNLGWPTPAIGWRNSEYPSFLDRTAGAFDAVMLLAVLHHLLVTERIPLEQVADLCDKLTTRHLIVEYVSPDDEMFKTLTRGRESLQPDFTQQGFEQAFQSRFQIINKRQVKTNLRWLYLLRKTH